MKILAARERVDKNDMSDTLTLLKRLNLRTHKEYIRILEDVRTRTSSNISGIVTPLFKLEERNFKFLRKALSQLDRETSLLTTMSTSNIFSKFKKKLSSTE